MNTNLLQIGDWIAVEYNGEFYIVQVEEITFNKIGVIFNPVRRCCDEHNSGKIVFIRRNNIHPIVLTEEMKKDLVGVDDYWLHFCKYLHELQHIMKIRFISIKEGKNKKLTFTKSGEIHIHNNPQDLLVRYGDKIIAV